MGAWGKWTATAVIVAAACFSGAQQASAQQCSAQNICQTTTQSNGSVLTDVFESDGRRNDNYQTRVTGKLAGGAILYDQIIFRNFGDPLVDAALEDARRAIEAAGGPGTTFAAPDFIEEEYSEELDQVFTEESEFDRPGGTVVTIQTTSGDAPNNFVYVGDRGGCFDTGTSGPTNIPPFTGSFANCDSNEETLIDPFTINTNTHTTQVTEHVYYSFTNEDYIIRQHYAVVGVAPSAIVVAPPALQAPVYDQSYAVQFEATGGVGPYGFAVSVGSIPNGLTVSGDGLMQGTPTAYGTLDFGIEATDANGNTGTTLYQVVIVDPDIDFTPAALPDGLYNSAYSQQLAGTNGRSPYSFFLFAGSFPRGVSMQEDGLISGTPLATGAFDVLLAVRDANNQGGNRVLRLDIPKPVITVAPAALPGGVVSQGYSLQLSASGAAAPYSFQLISGVLPGGMTFSAEGLLAGTPTASGTFPMTIRVADANGIASDFSYTLDVLPAVISIGPADLAIPSYNQAYAQQLAASGGIEPYQFSISAGSLPTGLALEDDGGVSGTPTAYGTFNFEVTAKDSNGSTGTRAYQLAIADPGIGFTPTALPEASYNAPYVAQLAGVNGASPYEFSLVSGTLPAGMSLNSEGLLSGVPSASGSFLLRISVIDANGLGTERDITLTVPPPVIAIAPAVPPDGTFGENYQSQFSATGGAAPYSFGIADGTLPAGLSLTGAGQLEGVARAAGSFPLTIRAIDANGQSGLGTFSLQIAQAKTSVAIETSLNPSNLGDPVTFTAMISIPTGAAAAAGTISFFADGTMLGSIAQTAGAGSFTTAALTAGSHRITATYSGNADYEGSSSASLTQTVQALGTVVIRQTVVGSDGSFGFTSVESSLTFTITTSGGSGSNPAVSLRAGTYSITAADKTGEGIALTTISCNDGDSTADVAGRTASIRLAPNEGVICTFASTNSRELTSDLIDSFIQARAGMILENQPSSQRRIDRFSGVAGGDPVATLLGYLPSLGNTDALTMSASLASMRRPGDPGGAYDAWFEGTYSRFESDSGDGSFGLLSFGADYLMNERLLAGAFVQIDRTDDFGSAAGGSAEGTGWLAGPYLTTRLSENVFLDLLAGAGTSFNSVSPTGTYTNDFDTSRWLVSATVQGDWVHEAWTFSPRARLSHFQEKSERYVDSLGVAIPSITVDLGQLALGPGISYRRLLEGGAVLDYSLRFDGVFDNENSPRRIEIDNLHGRIEGGIDAMLPNGMTVGISTRYGGLGSGSIDSYGGTVNISAPLN